jgi:tagatose 1,6-diphosphate aldolase
VNVNTVDTAGNATAWTPARARALDELSGRDGVIVGAAVDHRDSLRTLLVKRGLPIPDDDRLVALKLEIAAALAPVATVVLLDVEYGAAQALAGGALPGTTALAIALEAQGYGDTAASPRTSFLTGWSAEAAARLGASACKLLLPYRADVEDQAHAQDDVVRAAVAACRAAAVALVLEPIVYGEPAGFGDLVVAGARRLARLGPDVLKLQYPGSPELCAELDAACGSAVPWVLLGGGVDGDTLNRQLVQACAAGASGFIAGRTLWDAALVPDRAERERALREQCVPLLERLAAVAREHATPWRERVGEIAAPPIGWYRPS